MTTIRRVITGESETGKGVFTRVEDVEPIDSHIRWWGVWGWDEAQTLPVAPSAQFAPSDPFPPLTSEHGVRVSFTTFWPADKPALTTLRDDHMGRALTGGRMRERDLATGMHRTDSIEVVFVIDGEMTLEQDDGAEVIVRRGDCVVQNGARHMWRNASGEPALLAFVTFAADRRESG